MFGFGKKKKMEKQFTSMTPEEAYLEGKRLSGFEENRRFPEFKTPKALPYMEYAAKNGHALAQHALSYCYFYGLAGLKSDDAISLYWEEQAAEQDYAVSQEICGSSYERGLGCTASPEKAIYWYERCLKTLESNPDDYGDNKLDPIVIKRKISSLQYRASAPQPQKETKPASKPKDAWMLALEKAEKELAEKEKQQKNRKLSPEEEREGKIQALAEEGLKNLDIDKLTAGTREWLKKVR